jgi:glycosyltransferase involved in cell wall biosynthesis
MLEFASAEQTGMSTRRTVVFVESAAAMGGVQFSTLYLVQRLDPGLWEAIVVCPEEGDLTRACRRLGVHVHILNQPWLRSTSISIGRNERLPNPLAWAWNGLTTVISARRLIHTLKRVKPGLVLTKGLSSHFYGGLAARHLGIPCVWHVQDFISERFLGIYRSVFGAASRWLPDYIIVDGAAISRQLPRSIQDRISIIHNGVDTNVFRPGLDGAGIRRELGIPDDAIVIGHVARMTPWKGQHYLLEAFAPIAATMPNVHLLFVGAPVFDSDRYQRELLSLTSKLGLDDRVKFAGYRHDMPQVLAAMDVFAFTSVEKDTSPLALLSAMSSGLPIVAFDIEGVRELMKTDDEFLLVPAGQVAALAQSLSQILVDEKLRRRLAASARPHAEADFGLDRYASRMEEVLLRASSAKEPVARGQLPAELKHSTSQAPGVS